ncbi:MAG: hypothetical protein P1V81_13745 [Planctomycetota bacterium]|nr:hypothetical protein [Planctomycetota bacterium]
MKLLPLLPLSLLVAPAAAQGWDFQTLAAEGDVVPGVGTITSIQNIAVNNGLDWRVEADTDNPLTDDDYVLLGPSGLLLQENQSLPLPVGALLDSFDALTLDINSNSAVNFFLDGTTGSSDDSGIYYNLNLLVQEGQFTTATGVSAGTKYTGFFETKLADNGDILVMASMDDPLITSTTDRVLMRLTVDLAGNLASETVVWKESDVLPGTTGMVTDFGTGPHQFDMNDSGSILFYADTDLPTGTDGFIYADSTQLAAEGGPSPVVGRLWSSLASPEVALNNSGDYAFSGSLQGDSASNLLLVKNGSKFRQEGDPVPSIPAFTFTSFGSGPLDLADNGDLLWYGDWNDPATDFDTGLFLNDELIVQEGVTTIGGVVVDSLSGVQEGYFISDDGRFIIFEATLDDGTNGAFLATRSGSIVSVPGCFPDGSTMAWSAGEPKVGSVLNLDYNAPVAAFGVRYLGVSTTSLADGSGCGVFAPGIGEILIGITPPDPFLLPMGAHVGTGTTVPLAIPNDVSFVGLTFHLQSFNVYLSGPTPITITNALELTLGV